MSDTLILFDTTLRDGEQAPGFSMTTPEKLRIARELEQLGVDVIEAGFPAASDGDHASVQAVAREVSGPAVAGLCRCLPGDIERAYDAIRDAVRPRIHTFLATSPLHREHKLGMDRAEVLARIRAGVAHARSLCEDVEFSAEDATRTEPGFLLEVLAAALEEGATTLNVPDTVGYALPHEIEELFRGLSAGLPSSAPFVLSAHCHDDLGLAVANSLAAVRGGARQVEGTIGGIGERAGNAALEEVVMALRTRADAAAIQVRADATRLVPAAQALEHITGHAIPRNKAIIGRNAFSHESGIHQHGVLAHRATYEIMRAEDVGQRSTLVLGKHSGRHALRRRLDELGLAVEDELMDGVFGAFKELADRKSEIHDDDLRALVLGVQVPAAEGWTLVSLQTTAGTDALASSAVCVRDPEGNEVREAAVGDGPVDAGFRALMRATGVETNLRDYRLQSLTVGEDALGRATVLCQCGGRVVRGQGVSTDIVEASALAFLDAVNRFDGPGARIGRSEQGAAV